MKPPLSIGLFVVCLLSVHAQDLGRPVGATPYDPYFGPMRDTMGTLSDTSPPIQDVDKYVRTGRGFRYYMKHPHIPQTPAETEATRAGDCKAKSLWVADKMDDDSVRFVVGKAKEVSNMSHAWLLWKGPNGWLILDPTLYSKPISLSRVGPNEFVPLYSYTSNGKFIHEAAAARSTKPKARYGDH